MFAKRCRIFFTRQESVKDGTKTPGVSARPLSDSLVLYLIMLSDLNCYVSYFQYSYHLSVSEADLYNTCMLCTFVFTSAQYFLWVVFGTVTLKRDESLRRSAKPKVSKT